MALFSVSLAAPVSLEAAEEFFRLCFTDITGRFGGQKQPVASCLPATSADKQHRSAEVRGEKVISSVLSSSDRRRTSRVDEIL